MTPNSSSIMVHNAEKLVCRANPENSGAVTLDAKNDGWETFSITIFTDNAELSVEMAQAVNAVLAKHNRLYGQIANV